MWSAFRTWHHAVFFIVAIEAVLMTVAPTRCFNAPPVVIAGELVGPTMNATRMSCCHAKLRERGLWAGKLKPAEATTVQDGTDGALQFPRVGVR